MDFGSDIAGNTAVSMSSLRGLKPGTETFGPLRNASFKTSHILDKGTIEAKKAKLLKAAKDFEGILVKEILKSMRSTLTEGGMFGTGSAGEIYSDMMDDAIAQKVSSRGDMGLAEIIYKQMVKSIDPNDSVKMAGRTENVVKEYTGK